MKKLFFIGCCLFAAACTKVQDEIKPTTPVETGNTTAKAITLKRAESIHVRLRHQHCSAPLGVCVAIPIGVVADDPASMGTASAARVDATHLSLQFDQTTALESGIVPITEDIRANNICGYQEILIHAGQYQAAFSKDNPYGKILVDAVFTE